MAAAKLAIVGGRLVRCNKCLEARPVKEKAYAVVKSVTYRCNIDALMCDFCEPGPVTFCKHRHFDKCKNKELIEMIEKENG